VVQNKSLFSSCHLATSTSDYSVNLKEVLARKIPEHNKTVAEFRKQSGSAVIQEVTIDMVSGIEISWSMESDMPVQVYGGMRSMKGMVTETSVLVSQIRYLITQPLTD